MAICQGDKKNDKERERGRQRGREIERLEGKRDREARGKER